MSKILVLRSKLAGLKTFKSRRTVVTVLNGIVVDLERLVADKVTYNSIVRRNLGFALNSTIGLLYGVDQKLVNRGELIRVVKSCLVKLSDIVEPVDRKEEKKKEDKHIKLGWVEALKLFKEKIEEETPKNSEETTNIDIIETFRKNRTDLPISIQRAGRIVNLPLIPVGCSYNKVNTSKINRAGIDTVSFDVYKILLNQKILVLDPSKIPPYSDAKSYAVILTKFVAHINKKAKTDIRIVSMVGVPSPRNSKLVCYWVMDAHKLETVRDVFKGYWNFPF